MFQSLYNIFTSNNPNLYFLRLVLHNWYHIIVGNNFKTNAKSCYT